MRIYICLLIFIVFIIVIGSFAIQCNKEYFPSATNANIFSTIARNKVVSGTLPLTHYDVSYSISNYDLNNYNLQYHDSPEILEQTDNKMGEKGTWMNVSGKPQYVKWTDISSHTTYYMPGAFIYGASNYVPSYEDAAYMHYYKNK